jgi:hypothetical protein
MIEHGLPVVRTICQEMKVAMLRMSTQESQQLDRQLRPCFILMLRFGTDLGADVKTKKDGQAEDSVGAKRESDQDTKRNPIVPQTRHRAGLTALERIAKEANTEHVTTALTSKSVIEREVNRFVGREPGEQKIKEEKAERIEGPNGAREEAVKRAVMF